MARKPGFAGKSRQDEHGATMIEYALLLAFIALVCVVAVTNLGTSVKVPLQHVTTGMS